MGTTRYPPKGGHEGNPREGYPLKDNTAEGDANTPEPVAATQADPPQLPTPTPNGRETDGLPAINGPQAQGEPCKSPQTPIHLKAYAIMERLQLLHWDNCKITFGKEGARAYAEQALLDGHLEKTIVSAYATALSYCHGYATDEINDGKRHRREKANPALTIYLARKRLKNDGKTTDERWDATARHLGKQRQEITELSAEATAWFAQQHAAVMSSEKTRAHLHVASITSDMPPHRLHPAQGGVTAAKRSELGPATLASSGRSFSRHVVVAPRSPARDRLPPDTDEPCPVGPGHVPVPSPFYRNNTDTKRQSAFSQCQGISTTPSRHPPRVVVRSRPAGGENLRAGTLRFSPPWFVSTPQHRPSLRRHPDFACGENRDHASLHSHPNNARKPSHE